MIADETGWFYFNAYTQDNMQSSDGGTYLSYTVTAEFRIKEWFTFHMSKATITAILKITGDGPGNTAAISHSCDVNFP